MSVKTQLECDGCGTQILLAPGELTEFIRLDVLVSLNATADKKYDLCNPCVIRLEEQANPTNWSRVRASTI